MYEHIERDALRDALEREPLKLGEWIIQREEIRNNHGRFSKVSRFLCPFCHRRNPGRGTPYCPYCGAKLEPPRKR